LRPIEQPTSGAGGQGTDNHQFDLAQRRIR
jgi:hypothetical protein